MKSLRVVAQTGSLADYHRLDLRTTYRWLREDLKLDAATARGLIVDIVLSGRTELPKDAA